ncbi:MAG: elongation factor P maturation arginine rhamnosyltransferase EarP [Gallionella sp.]|nr:elongation factor P maturation arginine rhamnosyltransferase EarP [Gallionella sp.]MDD4946679.1 elongation factor P maturation arginine rhamnosyltransferase EarP [Gallionella sp.]MDD5612764.1 elongation factor P maturation arginine rhamnosyltransferase EarP [Gallionella sp.]
MRVMMTYSTPQVQAAPPAGAIPITCDIFCNVIDNYGDIGVAWRLARQLADELPLVVRLWVDELASFAKICPVADAGLVQQTCCGVEVRHWGEDFSAVLAADLVIDAFGCKLPEAYLAAMAARKPPPVWINLEYLSAEQWVEGCHRLPSPRPPLTRYFFFPGFTRRTGGLLLEHDLLARRDAFWADTTQQQRFWRSVGLEVPDAGALKVSLFGYENDALAGLFEVWQRGAQPVLCLVPEGRILPQVGRHFGDDASQAGKRYRRGNLEVCVLPFVRQQDYDALLWACDVNFVRGEDSCVRAQWAGKPFVWQIYPQDDGVHWQKLQAFLDHYSASLSPAAAQAVQGLWQAWNGGGGAGAAWPAFDAACGEVGQRSLDWAQELSANNLALNLLDFFGEVGRMRAFKIEGQ